MKDLENVKLSLNESNQLIITAIVDNKEVAFHVPATELLSTGNYDDVEVVEEPDEEFPPIEDGPIEAELPPVEPPKNTYKVWVKDTLWGKDYELSGDEWVWTRPTEHSYNVYVEGPAGSKVYPQIKRLGKLYTTKEDLTSRGPKIGFNKLQAIPQTLKGEGSKVLIGSDIGPGSSSAKGYDGYLILKDENDNEIKVIHMKYV